MDEATLVQEARRGSADALEALLRTYQKPIYNYAYRMTGNQQDAQDLTQETLVRVYTSISGFQGKARFSSWVYRIASNLCVDRLRRRRRTLSLDATLGEEELVWQVPDQAPGPEVLAEQADLSRAILQGLERLSYEHRAVVILHDMRQLTYGEVAEVLRCPVGTVKSRLSRARAILRGVLAEQGMRPGRAPRWHTLAVGS
ncbi:MAG TPA: RNA polymerase subunit sigma [Clostridiales bacterium UBA8153]|nr:RNA polymerase subunit sigma [Clostridiales bacterium UBA8153]